MNRSATAVVLSALVLPGAGQLYLNHIGRGLAFAGVSLVCLGVIVAETMQRASGLLATMEAEGEGALNAAQITAWVSQTTDDSSGTAMTLATLVLAACWLMAVVDAYRLGSRQPAGPGPEKKMTS